MSRMKKNLLIPFVFIWLVGSSVAALPRSPRKESTSGRNNLVDSHLDKSDSSAFVSDAATTYECLYVSPDLPVCDIERMEDSAEDITHSTADHRGQTKGSAESFGNDRRPPAFSRIRRNVGIKSTAQDLPGRQIIVYTIEGCLPPSLPFKMPYCKDKSPRDKILEVRKLYPFTVKGLTKPPLVFPEFNVDRWTRMMKRLRGHASTSTDKSREIIRRSLGKENSQSRARSLTGAAVPTKLPMPNRTSSTKLRSSLTMESDSPRQHGSTKKPAPNERKIKVDESLSPIRAKKFSPKRTFPSTELEKSIDLRPNLPYTSIENVPKKSMILQEYRRKKIPRRSSNDFRVLQKSWTPRDESRSSAEERSYIANHWNKIIQWSDDSEKSDLEFQKYQPRTKQRIFGARNDFGEISNDLGNADEAKYNDRYLESRKGIADMDEFFVGNSRKRREIGTRDDSSVMMIPIGVKVSESIGKSSVNRRRVQREIENSRGNDLHVLEKSNKFSNGKSSSFGRDARKLGSGIRRISGSKESEMSIDNTRKFGNLLNSGGSLRKIDTGDDSQKIGKTVRKKYGDMLDISMKHNKRIHRE